MTALEGIEWFFRKGPFGMYMAGWELVEREVAEVGYQVNFQM